MDCNVIIGHRYKEKYLNGALFQYSPNKQKINFYDRFFIKHLNSTKIYVRGDWILRKKIKRQHNKLIDSNKQPGDEQSQKYYPINCSMVQNLDHVENIAFNAWKQLQLYLSARINNKVKIMKNQYKTNFKDAQKQKGLQNLIYSIQFTFKFLFLDLSSSKDLRQFLEITALYKLLQSISHQRPQFMEIIRVKNRLDRGNKDILMNILYRKSIVIEMQLAIKSDKSKFIECSNKFNHYFYELQRSQFGPIMEMCSIWSSHNQLFFYRDKQKNSMESNIVYLYNFVFSIQHPYMFLLIIDYHMNKFTELIYLIYLWSPGRYQDIHLLSKILNLLKNQLFADNSCSKEDITVFILNEQEYNIHNQTAGNIFFERLVDIFLYFNREQVSYILDNYS